MAEGGSEARRLRRAALALGLSACAAPLASPRPPPSSRHSRRRPIRRPSSKSRTTSRRPTRSRPSPAPETKAPEHVPQDASGFHLSKLETKDLTLLYLDPLQTYLTPYIARAFENSIAFHEKNLHWKPWEPVTILLKDFSDYGNAAALGSPSDMVLLDVAPVSRVDGDLLARASASTRS